jgi:type II secretion system protein N
MIRVINYRMMKNFKIWLFYGLFAVVLALIFAYLRFPVETVERFIVAQSAQFGPEIQTKLEQVEPSFPPGIEIRRLSVQRINQPLFEAEHAWVNPRLKTILGIGTGYRFRILAHGGEITGTADWITTDGQPLLQVDVQFHGIDLSDLPLTRMISESPLQGLFSGKVSYTNGASHGRQVIADARVDNLQVNLSRPLMVLKQIRIESLRADAILKNEQLQVRQIQLSGDQVEGSLSGTGRIGRSLRDSRLDLEGRLKPQPGILQETDSNGLGGLLNQLASKGIPVRISGSLDDLELNTR